MHLSELSIADLWAVYSFLEKKIDIKKVYNEDQRQCVARQYEIHLELARREHLLFN